LAVSYGSPGACQYPRQLKLVSELDYPSFSFYLHSNWDKLDMDWSFLAFGLESDNTDTIMNADDVIESLSFHSPIFSVI
jgi:hypothetical protein